jgi:hypothetical protein
MTPQERELLEGFLSNLEKMHATNVDAEAEALIQRAIYNQPQAPYLSYWFSKHFCSRSRCATPRHK